MPAPADAKGADAPLVHLGPRCQIVDSRHPGLHRLGLVGKRVLARAGPIHHERGEPVLQRHLTRPAAILLEHIPPAHDQHRRRGIVRPRPLTHPEVGDDGLALALDFNLFHRRIEILARAEVGTDAVPVGFFLERGERAGKAGEAVIRFRLKKLRPRGGAVSLRGQRLGLVFESSPDIPPKGHPEIVGRPLEGGHRVF